MITPDSAIAADAASLNALAELLAPVCELALTEGVKLSSLVDLLKQGLVEAALALDAARGHEQPSDSRLSVMTGVHRKDLRRLRTTSAGPTVRRRSLASEVYARWMSDPAYLTRKGQPRVLPRQSERADQPSFESLVAGISTDVHPRAVLDELLRLGIVQCGPVTAAADGDVPPPQPGDRVRIMTQAFAPANDRSEQLRFLAANAADHLRAGNRNLETGGKAFLEQSIFADRLSEASADTFNRLTLQAWEQAFAQLMPTLRELYATDQAEGVVMNRRVRFGMYGYVGQADPQPESRSA